MLHAGRLRNTQCCTRQRQCEKASISFPGGEAQGIVGYPGMCGGPTEVISLQTCQRRNQSSFPMRNQKLRLASLVPRPFSGGRQAITHVVGFRSEHLLKFRRARTPICPSVPPVKARGEPIALSTEWGVGRKASLCGIE